MSKSRPKVYFGDDENDKYNRKIAKLNMIRDKRKEKRIQHALKTKNIDEYVQYSEEYVDGKDE